MRVTPNRRFIQKNCIEFSFLPGNNRWDNIEKRHRETDKKRRLRHIRALQKRTKGDYVRHNEKDD